MPVNFTDEQLGLDEHSLPVDILDVGGVDLTDGDISQVEAKDFQKLLVGRDYFVSDDGVVVGDGKNLAHFGMSNPEEVLNGEHEYAYVSHETVGTTAPQKYGMLKAEGGFEHVFDYFDDVEMVACDGTEKTEYVVDNADELLEKWGHAETYDQQDPLTPEPESGYVSGAALRADLGTD